MTRSRALLWTGLAIAFVALVVHVRLHAFQCDDAYISYRYARNLAEGHGLVFNPGFERVEGYSNFLWVLALAGLARLGVPPEASALPLSWAATAALWALVAAFAWRLSPERGRAWAVLVPAFGLATHRSFAVWASSGLETRAFELLVTGGALRLCVEIERLRAGSRPRLWSPWLFGLATLTRPDGLLFSACAFAAALLAIAPRGRAAVLVAARGAAPWVALVGAHFAFRRLYYGAWLPNTYYAKVGGRTWWDAGFDYLAAFSLEYAVYLWIPAIVAGAVAFRRDGRGHVPALFAALILPLAAYVAAIGGDHFEYRPIDLYLPFAFLLAGRGAQYLASPAVPAWRPVAVGAYLALALAASVELPWQSRAQFPARYLPGFPGGLTSEPERVYWLDPDRNLVHRLPGFRSAARAHLALLRRSSVRFVGVRAEEHARFLALVSAEGRRLAALVARGTLPGDVHIATGAVGAIPYYSGLRTLDRLGLTDAAVARSAPQRERVMAHDRSASFEYGRERGVDLWAAHDVHFLHRAGSPHPLLLIARRTAFWAAELDSGEYLLAMLPQGIASARARMPGLNLVAGASDEFLAPYVARSVTALRESLSARDDDARRRELAYFLLLDGRGREALAEYDRILARTPDDPEMLLQASHPRAELGEVAAARAGLERALALARDRGDQSLAGRIEHRLGELSADRLAAP